MRGADRDIDWLEGLVDSCELPGAGTGIDSSSVDDGGGDVASSTDPISCVPFQKSLRRVLGAPSVPTAGVVPGVPGIQAVTPLIGSTNSNSGEGKASGATVTLEPARRIVAANCTESREEEASARRECLLRDSAVSDGDGSIVSDIEPWSDGAIVGRSCMAFGTFLRRVASEPSESAFLCRTDEGALLAEDAAVVLAGLTTELDELLSARICESRGTAVSEEDASETSGRRL